MERGKTYAVRREVKHIIAADMKGEKSNELLNIEIQHYRCR